MKAALWLRVSDPDQTTEDQLAPLLDHSQRRRRVPLRNTPLVSFETMHSESCKDELEQRNQGRNNVKGFTI